MRSIRRAAIAGATAATLLVGAASVAVAEEATTNDTNTRTLSDKDYKDSKESSSKKMGSYDKGKKSGSSAGSSYENKAAAEVDLQTFVQTKEATYVLATGKGLDATSLKGSCDADTAAQQAVYAKLSAEFLDRVAEAAAKDSEFTNETDPEKREAYLRAKAEEMKKAEAKEFLENLKGEPGVFTDGKIKYPNTCPVTTKPDESGHTNDGYTYLRVPAKADAFSAKAGVKLEADRATNGRAVFGSDTSENDSLPKWAKGLKIITIIGAIGSLLGLVAFPAYNFLLANGYIR